MRKIDGAKKFKRRVLGLCGSNCIKSLDEVTQTLYQTGIISSLEEGRKIVESLDKKSVRYGSARYLKFEKVKNREGKEAYKIEAYEIPTDALD